ncbi:hypothetical protein PUNSTDRAFT_45173 [Punctularia strigosozonata HHB-11173 SS5]|uniref:uncharacterized protein n=1 Tax=Punctularia strigosozonata (strain HHB-11173) TaxID=741275 RepID=UPI0004417B04|nr:uncharacterized protein PUNSTDRAFT_45173 [Punctularia strigosozonata HHB-11173 SS5]EIN07636.1 hypothetical protein PUNSTDRAFT_45173 [Punctularia strigosozonata HHB-11173 SS5]
MSAPPSPRLGQAALDHGRVRKRDRPPALDIDAIDPKAASDNDVQYHDYRTEQHRHYDQPSVHISVAPAAEREHEPEAPRPASATSSLDPYYFSVHTPAESPLPPMPDISTMPDLGVAQSVTPDPPLPSAPITPARDGASIDRRGLVGVGELATPRWARSHYSSHSEEPAHQRMEDVGEEDEDQQLGNEPEQVDHPDSPWTIEAIDGEPEEKPDEEPLEPPRPLRTRPSIADESGGEEILYPRKPHTEDIFSPQSRRAERTGTSSSAVPTEPSRESPFSIRTSQRLRQKTSQELSSSPLGVARYSTTINIGTTVQDDPVFSTPKNERSDDKDDEKTTLRKHRSVNVPTTTASPRDKVRERRRESLGLTLSSGTRTSGPPKHARSASSSSSNHGERPHRRGQTSDFSHLPPSPSTSSIQQFLRHSNSITSKDPIAGPPSVHSSPNVGQSLLRGTQEGWSALDDEATAEALRKLDGISGKSARARTSIGSRPSSSSRPGTPGKMAGVQWEGIGVEGGKANRRKSNGYLRESMPPRPREEQLPAQQQVSSQQQPHMESGGEEMSSSGPEKSALKKTGTASARSSFAAKRGSSSSTMYTGTTTGTGTTGSSRDSAQLLVRRNSNGSDTSVHSSDVASLKDRAAALAHGHGYGSSVSVGAGSVGSGSVGGEVGVEDERERVPPVPPLPKDLSGFRSPPQSSASMSFPGLPGAEDIRKDREREREREKEQQAEAQASVEDADPDRTVLLEVPPMMTSMPEKPSTPQLQQQPAQDFAVGSAPAVMKSPSRKWSFNALGLGMKTPSAKERERERAKAAANAQKQQPEQGKVYTSDGGAFSFGSADEALSPGGASSKRGSWAQPQAMDSAASLASMSSIGSSGARGPLSPAVSLPVAQSKNESSDRLAPSRTETASSASHHTQGGVQDTTLGPLSPSSSSVRRQTSKRLTPSSIPFFRRSSSQSIKAQPAAGAQRSNSPSVTSTAPASRRLTVVPAVPPLVDNSLSSPSTPGSASAHKKSSVLSLGSLLKGSSSRKSLHSDKSDYFPEKDNRRSMEKSREKSDKEKKKDDKDRSESRISVLMGRKRGKTVSATDAKKAVKPVTLPPMQVQPLPRDTAQRVANLKSSVSSSNGPSAKVASGSRVTSQTISSMHKQSDTSLRSSRNQLPTIAGSPSVGINTQPQKEPRELPPSALNNSTSGLPKETPTKIPRISSRTSGIPSPTMKGTIPSSATSRRTSLNVGAMAAASTEPSPTPSGTTNEFGVLEPNNDEPSAPSAKPTAGTRLSVRVSPSQPLTRVPRQVSAPQGSSTVSGVPRKSNRESISFSGLRKSSTGSVASFSTAAPTETKHRSFALSPSKGLKLLSPKVSLSAARRHDSDLEKSTHSTGHLASAASSRQSLSTPSPAPSSVDEEEMLGDEEMMQYIKRQQAKKLAAGASPEEVNDMLKFPEPTTPVKPVSPEDVLNSSQVKYLSQYERQEILDYPSVYFIGARSQKKPATTEDSTNNHGYDDERGDYLVVNHDHLSYRYEVVGTLGKGSFGQVLRCRDHATGESVAVKIIRNKKRFHHQAMVEIKILDNLRKWDPEEKHQVIKMTEHFNFRGHLCIAMELLSINLYELIKANGFVGFTTGLIRRFTSQMLMSLSLMRHHRIVHCDLKPENVLLKHPAKSAIKVIDFGSSCFEHEKIYTYIQSRFYRSPEVILGMNYHMAIDMWSLGCILAELYTGFPIFPGENEQEQLSCIMEVLGVPDKDFINRSSRKRLFFDSSGAPRPVINSKGRRRRPGTKTLQQVLRCDDENFVDFIAKCLIWDPERRLKPQQALRHPFILNSRKKLTSPSPSAARSLLSSPSLSSGSRTKPTETPKKSQIGAPTPLTARSSRGGSSAIAATPQTSTLGASSRSYRASQSQNFASYHSSRTMSSFASSAK